MTIQKQDKPNINISVAAVEDLKDIWNYVAQNNEKAAGKIIKNIQNQFILLRDNPLIGIEQNKMLVGLRSFVVKNYFIFYLKSRDGIDILRVLHRSRNIENIFEEFFDSLSSTDDNQ